jgi:uncharacterized membrane protein YebE (DUF533 family)
MQVIEVHSSSNLSCDHANIIEENSRLKVKLSNGLATCIQGKKNLNDLFRSQRMNKGKEGLGFVAESSTKKKKSKKNKKKKKHTATPTPQVPFDICYTEEDRE